MIFGKVSLYFVFSARLVVVARVLRGRVIVELRERVSSKNDLFLYPEKNAENVRNRQCPAGI